MAEIWPKTWNFESRYPSGNRRGAFIGGGAFTGEFTVLLLSSQIIFSSFCHTKIWLSCAGISQAFYWYDNDKDFETYFSMTWLIRWYFPIYFHNDTRKRKKLSYMKWIKLIQNLMLWKLFYWCKIIWKLPQIIYFLHCPEWQLGLLAFRKLHVADYYLIIAIVDYINAFHFAVEKIHSIYNIIIIISSPDLQQSGFTD